MSFLSLPKAQPIGRTESPRSRRSIVRATLLGIAVLVGAVGFFFIVLGVLHEELGYLRVGLIGAVGSAGLLMLGAFVGRSGEPRTPRLSRAEQLVGWGLFSLMLGGFPLALLFMLCLPAGFQKHGLAWWQAVGGALFADSLSHICAAIAFVGTILMVCGLFHDRRRGG